jgi:hypothetical protein
VSNLTETQHEAVKRRGRDQYRKNRERENARRQRNRLANPERDSQYMRVWYEAHKEEERAKARTRMARRRKRPSDAEWEKIEEAVLRRRSS